MSLNTCMRYLRNVTALNLKTNKNQHSIIAIVGGSYGLVNLYFVHHSSNSFPLTLSGGPYEFVPSGYLAFVLKHSIRFCASLPTDENFSFVR